MDTQQDAPVVKEEVAEGGARIDVVEPVLLPLRPRQQRFVDEFVKDLNGKQAAIRAGYAENSATEQASELLTYPHVIAAIDRQKAQRAERVNISADGVLNEMSLLANSSIDHYYVDDNGNVKLTETAPEGAMRAIQSVKRKKTIKEDKDGGITITYDVEIRLWDKPNPLKLLGRQVGLFPNRVEVTGPAGAPIELTAVSADDLAKRAALLSDVAGKLKE